MRESRFYPGGAVVMNDLRGSGFVELGSGGTQLGLGFGQIAGGNSFQRLAHLRFQARFDCPIPLAAKETLLMTLLGAFGVGHVIGGDFLKFELVGGADPGKAGEDAW